MVSVRFAGCSLVIASLGCAQQASEKIEFFESRVRPVLARNCYSCHTDTKLGGLQVNSRVALLTGGKSGAAINVGNPDDSLLIRAVMRTDPNLKMPLGAPKLKDNEIADLKYWIQTGAVWPDADAKTAEAPIAAPKFTIKPEQRNFWSFQAIHKPAVPTVKDASWAQTPIDRFILAKLEESNLKPVKQADRRALIRRASYDLTGLPPTPEQVDAFMADNSPDAFAKIVDRLLATPQYGERWARHWLDVARYADGSGQADRRPVFLGYGQARDGYANTWRYRDWVAQAFNQDMRYDQFVKAQIAADLMPEPARDKMLPGLGFLGIGPWFTGDDVVFVEARANERDDKIDVVSKGFLGMTVACARCHNHKYDPISQKDYYAMAGIFGSTGYWEYNLAPEQQVQAYRDHRKKVKEAEAALQEYADACALRVAETLTVQIPQYMMAVRKMALTNPKPQKADLDKVAEAENLDSETLQRWFKYLTVAEKLHSYLKSWDAMMAEGGGSDAEVQKLAAGFRDIVAKVIPERKAVIAANEEMTRDYKPDSNEATVLLPGDLMQFELFQYKQQMVQKVMDTNHFYVWLDVVQGENDQSYAKQDGIFEYNGKTLLRFLTAAEKSKLDAMQSEVADLTKSMPPEYPYLMALKDEAKPQDVKLNVRGNPHALGEEVPRGFPAILGHTNGDPLPFTHGSGRMELADAIVQSPLAARVMVNRIWQHHFGRGLVDSPSNFGMMGERPSHPELLDYLASSFVENGWSMKALHREIMLSAVYQEAYQPSEADSAVDPDNRLLWRANFRRLEMEPIRDSMLFVAGNLDERVGGPPQNLKSANFKKRTFYARASRTPDGLLTLFDYPDPNITSEQRSVTNVPLQGLFFMNSDLVSRQADVLAARLLNEANSDEDRIQRAYRIVFQRRATQAEVQRGLQFLGKANVLYKEAETASPTKSTPWQQYAQALLSSGEFYYIN
jgi:hypothetical protein